MDVVKMALLFMAATFCGGGAHAQEISLENPSLLSATFDRPGEPIFYPRSNIRFELPSHFLPEPYSNMNLTDLFGEDSLVRVVRIPNNVEVPDMSFLKKLPRDADFSPLIPLHRRIAAKLTEMFMDAHTINELNIIVLNARANLNIDMVNYAQSVAILHRQDTQNVPIPNFACIDPGRFIGGNGVFRQLAEQSFIYTHQENERQNFPSIDIPRNYTGSDLDLEHRLAYFREDIGINLFYWNWHLVYPSEGPIVTINKDRRGELFYYVHQQIIARYNFERLCNKLERVKRFMDWREPIEEAYFPKLDRMFSSNDWPSRHANAHIKNLARPVEQLYIDIQDLERWRERIIQAIHNGRVQNENGAFLLHGRTGIDVLGNIIEANNLSINPNLYGNLYNMGHLLIAYLHDPDHRFSQSFGIMGDSATTMRDPAFYRWHAFINDLFQQYKSTLPSYSRQQFGFNNINVTSVEVHTVGQQNPNILYTFWQKNDLNVSKGINFLPRDPLFVRVTHLQHKNFIYTIKVQNIDKQRMGTARIFMAPHLDDHGLPMKLTVQRHLFIELDRFIIALKEGENIIVRTSNQSSVSIPFKKTFRDDSDQLQMFEEQYNHCDCGWPAHLLIPMGSPEGYEVDLFVMISNYADDQVNQRATNRCRAGSSYCGIKGELYPDNKPMGFPFDRPPPQGVESLDDLKSLGTGNIATIRLKIQHSNMVIN